MPIDWLVIGAAFAALVNGIVDSFLTPLIGLVGGGGELGGEFVINDQHFTWGAFLSTVIGFALTAAVVYFAVVVPMRKLVERRESGEEAGPAAPTEVELLAEIRDLLRAQRGAPGTAPGRP